MGLMDGSAIFPLLFHSESVRDDYYFVIFQSKTLYIHKIVNIDCKKDPKLKVHPLIFVSRKYPRMVLMITFPKKSESSHFHFDN